MDTAQLQLLDELLDGLSKQQKTLPCKFFYDERGSKIFEQICELDEYYPTRTELGIMKSYIDEMASLIGDRSLLIEYGSGASTKIRLLLDHLKNLAAYVPIDISADHLYAANRILSRDYPELRIIPVAADYTQSFALPEFDFPYTHRIVYFPGSTIRNFTPGEARQFLEGISEVVGTRGGLLIGVDLKKDRTRLEAAYNDARGVGDRSVRFEKGESILTEYSYKYTVEEFAALVSGLFTVEHVWTDDRQLFSVQYLSVRDRAS